MKKINTVLNKKVAVYGIGKECLNLAYLKTGLNKRLSPKKLKVKQLKEIQKDFKKVPSGKKLFLGLKNKLAFLFKIKSYIGVRHKLKYPVRGQRTHTNARTKKKL